MKKGLIAIFMVALMLITVLSGVVSVNAVSVSKEISEDNNDSGDSGFCTVLCFAFYYNTLDRGWYEIAWGAKLVCEDLSTGEVQEDDVSYGFFLLTNLRWKHDYKFTLQTPYGKKWWTTENLGIFTFGFQSYDIYI